METDNLFYKVSVMSPPHKSAFGAANNFESGLLQVSGTASAYLATWLMTARNVAKRQKKRLSIATEMEMLSNIWASVGVRRASFLRRRSRRSEPAGRRRSFLQRTRSHCRNSTGAGTFAGTKKARIDHSWRIIDFFRAQHKTKYGSVHIILNSS